MTRKSQIIISSIIACLIMFVVETYIKPGFVIKSLVKLVVFTSAVLAYVRTSSKGEVIFKMIDRSKIKYLVILGFVVYYLLLGGYSVFKDFIDLEKIKQSLLEKEGVGRHNFIYVTLYISIINSFLEEMFFRGFIFKGLKDLGDAKLAYIFSSILFALYHIAIMGTWFSPWMLILLILGLVATGIFFDYMTERFGSFLAPWFVHAMANLAINTVGFFMLDIIHI